MPQLEGFDPAPIPGPRPLPLVGTRMRQYAFLEDPVGAILDLRTYGNVTALVDQDPSIVCVFGPERNQDVLGNPQRFQHDDTTVADPPGSDLARLGQTLQSANGAGHERGRKPLLAAFEGSALDDYGKDVVRVTARLVDRWPLEGIVQVDDLCRQLALGVAAACFLGIDVDDPAIQTARLVAKLIEARNAPTRLLFPDVNVPGFPKRRMLKLARAAARGLGELIARQRTRADAPRDALGRLVNAGQLDPAGVSDDVLAGHAMTLFTGGHEPLGAALAWTLFLLDQHPDRLQAVQHEIDQVLQDQPPTIEVLPQLGKLDRVVKESLRVLAPMPLLFLRVVAENTELGGRPLPARANVVVSPLATHHDADLFPHPRRFDPDRWFEANPGPFAYFPFGAGARACVGRIFADRAIRLMLAMILQRRRLRTRPGTKIDRLTRGNVLHFKRGLPMRITRPKEPFDLAHRVRGDVRQLVDLPADS